MIRHPSFNTPQKGVSVIEMLTAIGIFLIIFISVSQIFVSSLSLQRRILAQREVLDQASYFMEYLSRALRMAKKDDNSCGSTSNYQILYEGKGIKFKNYDGKCQQVYWYQNDEDRENTNRIKDEDEQYLTPKNLEIKKFQVKVSGDVSGDNSQPRVTVVLELESKGITPGAFGQKTNLKIQTTVSQRDLDR